MRIRDEMADQCQSMRPANIQVFFDCSNSPELVTTTFNRSGKAKDCMAIENVWRLLNPKNPSFDVVNAYGELIAELFTVQFFLK